MSATTEAGAGQSQKLGYSTDFFHVAAGILVLEQSSAGFLNVHSVGSEEWGLETRRSSMNTGIPTGVCSTGLHKTSTLGFSLEVKSPLQGL